MNLKLFFSNLRQKLFSERVEGEIYFDIAQHVTGQRDHGYPFYSQKELANEADEARRKVEQCIREIEDQAGQMGQGYGNAFRYIMYRDLMKRLRGYSMLAKRRVFPKMCDPRFVARHA